MTTQGLSLALGLRPCDAGFRDNVKVSIIRPHHPVIDVHRRRIEVLAYLHRKIVNHISRRTPCRRQWIDSHYRRRYQVRCRETDWNSVYIVGLIQLRLVISNIGNKQQVILTRCQIRNLNRSLNGITGPCGQRCLILHPEGFHMGILFTECLII